MKHRKTLKLVSEIVNFFFDSGATKIGTEIEHDNNQVIIEVKATVEGLTPKRIEEVKNMK